jgi:V8-like Glu-specific endopeptidase
MLRARDWGVRRARSPLWLALAAALAAGAFPERAPAFEPAVSGEAVRDYWTPERMREAIPIGPLGRLLEPRGDSTIADRIRHPRRRPMRSHGKVFLTLGGVDYVCSGTAVRSPRENVVWTAGHCVYGPAGLGTDFASNFMFAPAYREGRTPFGEWVANELRTTPRWKNSSDGCLPLQNCGNVAHDFGAANVGRRGGNTLQDVVGGRGIRFNGARDGRYHAIGYPQDPPFDGQRMWGCRSPYRGADNSAGNPPPMRIRCDMTGGSSGGGWIKNGKVSSVVSYGYADEPNNLYGPYQGASARDLYQRAKD